MNELQSLPGIRTKEIIQGDQVRTRITLVIPWLGRGGAERVMCTLANAWAAEGKDVTILTLHCAHELAYPIDPSVKVRYLGVTGASFSFTHAVAQNFRRAKVLRSAIRDSRPDVVISFIEIANVATLLATTALRVPVIVSERIDPSLHPLGPVWDILRRITYRCLADALVCQTQSTLARFQKMIKVRGCVIPNPVVMPQEPGKPYGKRRNGASTRSVTAMGRLVPQKGFDLLLQAFARIAWRHPDWSLTIYGEGPLRNDLETQAKMLGLSDRVQMPGEIVDSFAAFRDSDLFVLSSRFEGFPNVLCEAMASGLPVISFDCPSGAAEIIHHEIDGVLVPQQDVNALAGAMDRLMGNESERSRLALHAPEMLGRFSLERILSLWQRLFEEIDVEHCT